MEYNTLRCVTSEISCRKMDAVLEGYLPEYISEMTALLEMMHEESLNISLELEPAMVFSL